MMPDQRPSSEEVALASAPRNRCVEAETSYWEVESEFGILLQKIRDLQAGEIRYHKVGLGRADLEEESREIGGIGRHVLIGRKLPAVGLHQPLGNPQSIVT